jgi:hypothetical protein
LIADTMRRQRISARKAAKLAGLSDAWWRHVVNGYQPVGQGQFIPVVAPPDTLARMAKVIGISEAELQKAGRADAAEELARLAVPGEDDIDLDRELAIEIEMISDDPNLTDRAKQELVKQARAYYARQRREQEALRERQAEDRRAWVESLLRIAAGNPATR